MNILFGFIVGLHILVCLFLIGVVLLQQGRSADLAGAFGGQGSQTAFGPRAAGQRAHAAYYLVGDYLMLTSISLTILYQRSTGGSHSVLENSKPAPASEPAKSGK